MATNSENWEIDGVDLSTYAFNITSLSGRLAIPARRGGNRVIPYRRGTLYVPKTMDEGKLSLGMWVVGAQENGQLPAHGDQARQFNQNLDKLREIFGVYDRELAITKRWVRGSDGVVLVLSGKGECIGTLDPTMTGRARATFVAEIAMADPLFYAPLVTTNVPLAGAVVANPGQVKARRMTIRLNGPLTNPTLRNTTPNPDIDVTYTGVLTAGQWVDLDVENFTAKNQAGVSVIGAISHTGARHWMELDKGNNTMTLTASAGTGSADVKLQAAYF